MKKFLTFLMFVLFGLTGCEDQYPTQIPQKVGTVHENGVTYDLMRYPNPDGTYSTYKVHPGPYYANGQAKKWESMSDEEFDAFLRRNPQLVEEVKKNWQWREKK
jgi:hypothetical protein